MYLETNQTEMKKMHVEYHVELVGGVRIVCDSFTICQNLVFFDCGTSAYAPRAAIEQINVVLVRGFDYTKEVGHAADIDIAAVYHKGAA